MTNRPWRMLLVLVWALMAGPSPADPPKGADPRDGFRQLGNLRAGLAYQARENERSPVKAGLFSLQAAQAFHQAGDVAKGKEALVAGIVAAQPLRASWLHERGVVAMSFLPGDNQVLTCGTNGRVHIWDVATGGEARSFGALDTGHAEKFEGASLSPDLSRLVVWERKTFREERKTLQLWDVGKGRLLREWDRAWQPGPRGGDSAPAGAVFLGDGKRLLLWGTEKPVQVWDADGKEMLHTIDKATIEHSPPLNRDGSRLLTSDRSAVRFWDLTRGKLLRTFEIGGGEEALRSLLSPDERHILVMGDRDATARLFDASTGKLLAEFVHYPRQKNRNPIHLHGAVFSPHGTRLLTWAAEHTEKRGWAAEYTVKLWDVKRERLLFTFKRGRPLSAQFHRNGSQVLTMGDSVVLWDAKTGEVIGRYGDGYGTFTRDGSRLLTLDPKLRKGFEMWDVKGEKLIRTFETPGSPYDFRMSADETLLLVNVSNEGLGAVQLWNLSQPDALQQGRTFKHEKPVCSAALSRDEARLLTCDEGDRAYLWDARRGGRIQSFAHGDGILGASFNPDESRLLTWGEKGVVKLWDSKTAKEVRTFGHPADVRGAAFSPDGSHLLTRDADYTVWWWDVSRPKPVHKLEHPRDVFGALLSPKATRILTWGLDGKARLWDVASGGEAATLVHDGAVFGATFAGEDRVWTWSPNGMREWDATEGKVRRRQQPPDGVASAELSRDGKRFLLRTAEGLMQLWDVNAEKSLARFHYLAEVWESPASGLAGTFNPDQTRILTWPGGSVHLWDLASGVELKSFPHQGVVRGAAFTRDESQVLTWGADGTARLLEASVPRPLSPDDQLLEMEVRCGLHVDEAGQLRGLRFEEWQDRRKKLDAIRKKNEGS